MQQSKFLPPPGILIYISCFQHSLSKPYSSAESNIRGSKLHEDYAVPFVGELILAGRHIRGADSNFGLVV
jgi:hypothetical protein